MIALFHSVELKKVVNVYVDGRSSLTFKGNLSGVGRARMCLDVPGRAWTCLNVHRHRLCIVFLYVHDTLFYFNIILTDKCGFLG